MASFFVPGGNSPEVLEAIDAALNDVSAFIKFCIERSWSPTCTAPGNTRFARILALWTDHPNAALTQQSTVLGLSIGAIHAQDRRTLPGASWPRTSNANGVQDGNHERWITGLTCGEQYGKRETVSVGQDMNFGGPSTPTDSEPLVLDAPLFSSLARRFCAPTALRWA